MRAVPGWWLEWDTTVNEVTRQGVKGTADQQEQAAGLAALRKAFERHMAALPLVAILRGITPAEIVPVAQMLWHKGWRLIEIPLNSPDAFESISRASSALGPDALVGAGTVLSPDAVTGVQQAGGRLVVMPHSDPAVIAQARRCGLICTPGVATPTEAFAALHAGADALKLFPAEQLGPAVVKAWRAVIPVEVRLMPVGGITPESMASFVRAGASGFGLGGGLYRAGMPLAEITARADAYVAAWHALQ